MWSPEDWHAEDVLVVPRETSLDAADAGQPIHAAKTWVTHTEGCASQRDP